MMCQNNRCPQPMPHHIERMDWMNRPEAKRYGGSDKERRELKEHRINKNIHNIYLNHMLSLLYVKFNRVVMNNNQWTPIPSIFLIYSGRTFPQVLNIHWPGMVHYRVRSPKRSQLPFERHYWGQRLPHEGVAVQLSYWTFQHRPNLERTLQHNESSAPEIKRLIWWREIDMSYFNLIVWCRSMTLSLAIWSMIGSASSSFRYKHKATPRAAALTIRSCSVSWAATNGEVKKMDGEFMPSRDKGKWVKTSRRIGIFSY